MPLQGLISYTSEELALSLGQTLGGLLNAIIDTATELTVCFTPVLYIVVKSDSPLDRHRCLECE